MQSVQNRIMSGRDWTSKYVDTSVTNLIKVGIFFN